MIALVLIHNHRFDRNLPLLDALYQSRFDRVWHLMPFYDGERENVIPVYENSLQFQGYVAQGQRFFEEPGITHYFFAADDMLLHPSLSADNLCAELGIKPEGGFFEKLRPLHDEKFWGHTEKAFGFEAAGRGSEGRRLLPSPEEVEARFARHGLTIQPVPGTLRARPPQGKWWSPRHWAARQDYAKMARQEHPLPYPFLGSYADYFVVPAAALKKFAHYCGIFASLRLFVEIALPTAMIMAVDDISTLAATCWQGGALWSRAEVEKLGQDYHWDLDNLRENFPANTLYLHPVKLSQWKQDKA